MTAPPNGPVVFLLGERTPHAEFERVARGYGWVVHEDRPAGAANLPYEQIWVTTDRGTAIHYLDDPTPAERFLVVYGPDAGDVAFDLGMSCDITTSEDVLDHARQASTDAERATLAWRLAVVSKLFDADAMAWLTDAYRNGSELVRHAVINGVGYRGWEEALPFLEEISQSDPSAELRENAAAIVAAWRKVRLGSGDSSDP